MLTSQHSNGPEIFCRATLHQRLCAGVVFLAVFAVFLFFWLAAIGKIDIGLLLGPCGFKQRYGLACPTCGITTSAIAFCRGRIFEAFYIQPAGALLCTVLFFTAILSFLIAVFGIYSPFLGRFFNAVKAGYIVLAVIIIIAAGWAVTLARSLAEKSQ